MTAGDALRLMAALPVAPLDAILRGQAPLVLAPHPDDESLGCGGLIAAAAAAGLRPAILVVTDGTGSHPGSRAFPPDRLRTVREAEARDAASILGVEPDRVGFLRLQDTAAPTAGPDFAAAVAAVSAYLERWGCGVLLAPWRHDPHGDHVAVAAMARAVPSPLLSYPVWGLALPPETVLDGPEPAGYRLDIAPVLERKRRAIAAHRSQHGALVTDDPAGFTLDAGFVERFLQPFETYLQ